MEMEITVRRDSTASPPGYTLVLPANDDQEFRIRSLEITALEHPFLVTKPIPVSIRRIDNGFVASFEDANVNASGDTKVEAVENLLEYIVDLYDTLAARQPDTLGPGVTRQLETMRRYMRKQPNA